MKLAYCIYFLWSNLPNVWAKTENSSFDVVHTNVTGAVPIVSTGSKMMSTPPTVSPCEGVIGFRSSVQVVVGSMAGGLPKKHWKQVLVTSSGYTS